MFVFIVRNDLHKSAHNALFRIFTGINIDACDLLEQLIQIVDLRTTTGNVDTGMDDIFCQLWRSILQYYFYVIADTVQIVLDRFVDHFAG